MNQGKHTPGPWKAKNTVARDGITTQYIECAAGCIGHTAFGNVSEQECAANAALISAAPDLLAACEALVRRLGDVGEPGSLAQEAIDFARAAIAKARGGAA